MNTQLGLAGSREMTRDTSEDSWTAVAIDQRLQDEVTQVYITWGQVSSQNFKFSTLQTGDNNSIDLVRG